MRTALLAGSVSFGANLLILYAFIPPTIGFRLPIIAQIAFWTFFAAIGATSTSMLLKKVTESTTLVFVALAVIVFFFSLIPIYLHAGILYDFDPSLLMRAIYALVTMHIVDALLISSFVMMPKE